MFTWVKSKIKGINNTMSEEQTLTDLFNSITKVERKGAGRPSAKKDREALVEKLKENDTFIVRTILQANFNEKIKFPFPPGEPPYEKKKKKVPFTDDMIRNLGRCSTFAKGLPIEKERVFIDLLENIYSSDAKILCLVKDRKLAEKYPSITEDVIKDVWKDLI